MEKRLRHIIKAINPLVFNVGLEDAKSRGYVIIKVSEKAVDEEGVEWYSALIERIDDMTYKLWGR